MHFARKENIFSYRLQGMAEGEADEAATAVAAVLKGGLACCLFELATRRFLFPGSDSNHTLRAMQEMLGPIPTAMVQGGSFAHKHFDTATGARLGPAALGLVGRGGGNLAALAVEAAREHLAVVGAHTVDHLGR